MAVYKLFPTKDSSIYSKSGSMNTGIDEILDASTYIEESKGSIKLSSSEDGTTWEVKLPME